MTEIDTLTLEKEALGLDQAQCYLGLPAGPSAAAGGKTVPGRGGREAEL